MYYRSLIMILTHTQLLQILVKSFDLLSVQSFALDEEVRVLVVGHGFIDSVKNHGALLLTIFDFKFIIWRLYVFISFWSNFGIDLIKFLKLLGTLSFSARLSRGLLCSYPWLSERLGIDFQ